MTPEEQKTRELKDLKNRSEQASIPIQPFQLEPFPPSIVKAFPDMEAWLKRQNVRLIDDNKRLNVTLGRT